ncbi:succinyl-CoA ligase, putative [Plasmodium ovale curtisi]|uniref:Succinyl-CoA ligase, putative n=2 Tax=Plasmodium ovale TaxID=36330 RepID=A0A1A8W632_PLAOA|nr:succinyl-CoA ligase, putative [Plasmodium ovale curtisi]
MWRTETGIPDTCTKTGCTSQWDVLRSGVYFALQKVGRKCDMHPRINGNYKVEGVCRGEEKKKKKDGGVNYNSTYVEFLHPSRLVHAEKKEKTRVIPMKGANKFLVARKYYGVWVGYNKNVQPSAHFRNSLDFVFKPKSIGIVGATERKGSVGNSLVNNLLKGEGNYKLYFINSKGSKIYDRESYKSLSDIKDVDNIDLAIIAVPRNNVLSVMKELKNKNVKGVVIITAGFRETGEEGLKLEKEIVQVAKHNDIRIVGPNCLGIIHAYHNMNASFAENEILKGNFSLLSQSGAICSAALDLSLQHNIGFSHFISVGSMCDVQFYELVEYLFYDKNTKCILLYVESIGDINKFVAVCKKVCMYKPIILLKSGKTAKAAEAAISHTGSMVGNYDIFYASMKKLGVLVVENFEELFNMCKILNIDKYPETNELCVVTNAGGPGVLLVDNIIKNNGFLSNLNEKLKKKLDTFLPESWSKANPVDILGDASPTLYKKTVETLIQDDQYKNIILLLSPQSVTDPLNTAKEIINLKNNITNKGIVLLCNYLGGTSLEDSTNMLNKHNIPTFVHPEDSAQNLLKLFQNVMHIQGLYEEIPDFLATQEDNFYVNNFIYEHIQKKQQNGKYTLGESKKQIAFDILKKAINRQNYILNEFDSKAILETYGIPIVDTKIYITVEDIVKNANNISFPCAMKIYSDTITHKKDIGGVILNITSEKELVESFQKIYDNVKKHNLEKEFKGVTIQKMVNTNEGIELILGYYYDVCFGPVLLFGSGGSYVEIFKDTVLLIPPLHFSYTHHIIKNTKIYNALLGKSSRFKKCDIPKLITTVIKFSEMILDLLPYINECDINPLFVSGEDIVALDARFTLRKEVKNMMDAPGVTGATYAKTFTGSINTYPLEMVSFHDLSEKTDVEKGTTENSTIKKGDSIARSIHLYDFKLMHKFLKENYKELHKRTFFFTSKETIQSKLFAYDLCSCDYDLYNVILFITKKVINGLVKMEKRNGGIHSYIYSKDEYIFSLLIQKVNIYSKNQELTSFVYLKSDDSPFAQLLMNTGYQLDHTLEDITCYSLAPTDE